MFQDEEGAADAEQHVNALLAKLVPTTCPGHALPELARVAAGGGVPGAARWALWALARIVCSEGAAGGAYVPAVTDVLCGHLERVAAEAGGACQLVMILCAAGLPHTLLRNVAKNSLAIALQGRLRDGHAIRHRRKPRPLQMPMPLRASATP